MILWTIVPGVLSVLLVAMLREPEGLAVGNGKIDWQWQSLPAPLKRYLVALGCSRCRRRAICFVAPGQRDRFYRYPDSPVVGWVLGTGDAAVDAAVGAV